MGRFLLLSQITGFSENSQITWRKVKAQLQKYMTEMDSRNAWNWPIYGLVFVESMDITSYKERFDLVILGLRSIQQAVNEVLRDKGMVYYLYLTGEMFS